MFKSFIVAIIALLCVVFMYGCTSQTAPSVTSSDVEPSQTIEEMIGLDESWSELDDQRILNPDNGMVYWYHYNDDGEVEINTDEYGNVSVAGMSEVTTNGSR